MWAIELSHARAVWGWHFWRSIQSQVNKYLWQWVQYENDFVYWQVPLHKDFQETAKKNIFVGPQPRVPPKIGNLAVSCSRDGLVWVQRWVLTLPSGLRDTSTHTFFESSWRHQLSKFRQNYKDKDADRITGTVLVCSIFGILMTQAFKVWWWIPSVTNMTNVTNMTHMTNLTSWDPVGLPLDTLGPCRHTPWPPWTL